MVAFEESDHLTCRWTATSLRLRMYGPQLDTAQRLARAGGHGAPLVNVDQRVEEFSGNGPGGMRSSGRVVRGPDLEVREAQMRRG